MHIFSFGQFDTLSRAELVNHIPKVKNRSLKDLP